MHAFALLRSVFMMCNNYRKVSHWLNGRVGWREAQQEPDT